MGGGKPIEITLDETPRGTATIAVCDHGIGIAAQDQVRIFERFERVVSQRHYGGFGLGLWIVRQLVEAHGGQIGIWSQPGAGAIFKVELPKREVAKREANARGAGELHQTIMLVDDDPMIRDSFRDALEDEGYTVVVSYDGRHALDTLRRGGVNPSLIFLDLMMPEMDGATFRAEQQKDPDLADIPVVILSASGSAERLARSLGAAAWIPKPMDLESVLKAITKHCRVDPRAM